MFKVSFNLKEPFFQTVCLLALAVYSFELVFPLLKFELKSHKIYKKDQRDRYCGLS